MKYLLLSFLFISMMGNSQTTDLLISEYGEGNGGNKKYIEIYNGTGASVDLSNYSLWKSANGAAWSGTTLNLVGTLLNDSTYVVSYNSTDVTGADSVNTFLSFNGNDAVGLAKNGTLIDVLGEASVTSTYWPVAGTNSGMKDKIIIRKPSICSPNTNWVTSSGTNTTDSEWIIAVDPYNNINQTTDLGKHTANCAGGCETASTISAEACISYTSPSGNYTWTTSNTYKDTVQNAAMCDSVITINLTINQPETNNGATASICTGQTLMFGTQTLTDADAGAHTEVFQNMNGCDSTVNLTLTVVTGYTETATATICEGETYIFGTQNLTTEGGNPYMESFTSVGGCDSTVTLTLTVTPRTYKTITLIECDSYTSPSGNYTWTTSNTYNDTIPNAAMCDSVITIDLTIKNSNSSSLSVSVCDSYDFLGNTLTASGIYIDTTNNTEMCDSIITLTLDITTTPSAPTTSSDLSYCENDILADMSAEGMEFGELIIAGIADGPLPGGVPKVVEFYAIQDIADLSIYGFGSASNGQGTDGEEFTFPALSLTAGDYYYVSTDSVNFNSFFGFNPNYSEGTASNNNGDDAIELFKNGVVIDVFGEISVDGTGQAWEYLDGWAYRKSNSLPNGGVFNVAEWTYSGVDGLTNGVTNVTCDVPFPIQTMTTILPTSAITWYSDAALMNSIGTASTQTPSATNGATTYYATETLTGATTCESLASMVTITINPNPTNVTFSALANICENTSYTLVEGAPAGGVYSGTGVTAGDFTSSMAGSETLTYTYTDGNDCSASATQSITIDAAPTVTFAALSNVCIYNSSMVLTGGLPAGGTYSGDGVNAGEFDPADAGNGTHTITYSYTDGNGCEGSATSTITVDGCASIDENNTIGLAIFPNPTNGLVTITFDGNVASVAIVDITGKTISNSTITSSETVDLSALKAGTYFINVNVDGKTSTERVIIK